MTTADHDDSLEELAALGLGALDALKRLNAAPVGGTVGGELNLQSAELVSQAVTRFIEAFDVWFANWGSRSREEQEPLRGRLEEVGQIQNQVVAELARVQQLQPAALRALRKRGRALVRYVDGLPIRSSTRRSTKL